MVVETISALLEKRQVARKWNTNVSLVFGTASTNTSTKTVDTSLATKETPEITIQRRSCSSHWSWGFLIDLESWKTLRRWENQNTSTMPPPQKSNWSFSNHLVTWPTKQPPPPSNHQSFGRFRRCFPRRGPRHWVYRHVDVLVIDGGNPVNSPVEVGRFFSII